ncbi:hypothetical protein LUZ60_002752 [Juncus effusus]|nr:hypothetical protein LUZ60_002752 [Juncus effusus]
MGWIKVKTFSPLIFQSKLFCLSFFYLCTTLPFSIYVSLSQNQPNKCLFLSLPISPKSNDVFSYPSSYGEHKHALPSTRSDHCTSPIHFDDYKVVFEELQDLYKNLSMQNQTDLRYMNIGNGSSFSGNFSIETRMSFFNYSTDDPKEVPCGMMDRLPIKKQDLISMQKCTETVVISAVFNDHDKIRQPRGLASQTLSSFCFFLFLDSLTLQTLILHQILPPSPNPNSPLFLGVWRLVPLPTNQLPFSNPAMNGVILKHLTHRLFPNSKFSIWVDGKLQLTVDPVLLINSLLIKNGGDVAVGKHGVNRDVMEEAMATVRWRKWGDVEGVRAQMETYCEVGFEPWSTRKMPYTTDVPDTALIIRRHNLRSNLFSCLLFNELEAFNPRDQLAFAFVRDFMNPKININMFDVEVFEHVAIEYRHNLKKEVKMEGEVKGVKMGSSRDLIGSSCEKYLSKMWGE